MSSEKTIALCLIVKNEGKVLPRLIASCKQWIDYWVICDTGSTDNTRIVVQDLLNGIPGELLHEDFVNFSHNRNILLNAARGKADYLLLADADFIFHIDRLDKSKLTADKYYLWYSGMLSYAQPLLVSGALKWYYVGYTHEYITCDEPTTGAHISERTLVIEHRHDSGTQHVKYERDIKMCLKEIEDYPNRPRPWFYLAQTYLTIGRYDDAINAYKERIQRAGWPEEIFYSLYQVGVALAAKGDRQSAILQFLEAYDYRPSRFEPLFMIGQLHRQMKKYSTAKLFLERVLKMEYPKNDILFINRIHKQYMADFELGICDYWLGNIESAGKHCRKVMNTDNVPQVIEDANKRNYEFVRDKLSKKKMKVNDLIFVSMFTIGTSYQDEVKILEDSLNKFKLPHEIVGVRPQGSWEKNTHQKVKVILDVMNKSNKDVVWVDADAEIVDYPEWLFEVDADLSFHTIKQWDEMLTGTVYFKNTQKVKDFLNQWRRLNSKTPDRPDAWTFQALLHDDTYLKKVDMPAEYVKIFDSTVQGKGEPVILHNQASRRYKDEVNTGKSPENIIMTLLKHECRGYDAISVIGNGPHSSKLKEIIDDSFIVRCNDFRLSGHVDYIHGRTDLNVNSLYHEVVPKGPEPFPIFGILPISDTLYQEFTDAKQMHHHWSQNAMNCINAGNMVWTYGDKDDFAKIFRYVAEQINAFPTVGILAIAMARELGFKKIILSGFTFFESDKSHYWKDEVVKPSSHHNPSAEKELLKKWMHEDNVEYILDEEVRKQLSKTLNATT